MKKVCMIESALILIFCDAMKTVFMIESALILILSDAMCELSCSGVEIIC